MGSYPVDNISDYIDSSRPVLVTTKHSEYFNNIMPTTMGELLENNIWFKGYVTNRNWDYYDNEFIIHSYARNTHATNDILNEVYKDLNMIAPFTDYQN